MSQFAEPVIPDERRFAGEIRNPVKGQYNQILSGSRLASAGGGLGRDDELRRSLLRADGICSYPAELSEQAYINKGGQTCLPSPLLNSPNPLVSRRSIEIICHQKELHKDIKVSKKRVAFAFGSP